MPRRRSKDREEGRAEAELNSGRRRVGIFALLKRSG